MALQPRHTEGSARFHLSRRNRQDSAAQDLGRIGALHEAQHVDTGGEPGDIDPLVTETLKGMVQKIGAGIVEQENEHQFGHRAD